MGLGKKLKNLAKGKKADGSERKNMGDRRVQKKDRKELRKKKRKDEKAQRKLDKIALKGEQRKGIWGIRKGNRGANSGKFFESVGEIAGKIFGGSNGEKSEAFEGQNDGSINSLNTGVSYTQEQFKNEFPDVHLNDQDADNMPKDTTKLVGNGVKYIDMDGDFRDDESKKYIWQKQSFESSFEYVKRLATYNVWTKIGTFIGLPLLALGLAKHGFTGLIKKIKSFFK